VCTACNGERMKSPDGVRTRSVSEAWAIDRDGCTVSAQLAVRDAAGVGCTPAMHLRLGAGINIEWLAEHCGNSIALIEKQYGRFLAGDVERQLGLLMAGRGRIAAKQQERAKPSTFPRRFAG